MTGEERAVLRAMHLLTARDYTEKQLRDKLAKGEYTEDEIQIAMDYVKSYHYIDDKRYVSSYLEYYKDSRSYRRMENDLIRKGIAPDFIKLCWEEKLEKGCDYDEGVMIARIFEKKHFDPNAADYKEKQKMAAFLYRRGFRMDVIRRYMLLDIS